MRTTGNWPLVDVGLALDLLAAAVADRGEDYRYPPVPDPELTFFLSLDDAAPTLLEHALSPLSPDETELARLRHSSVRVLHEQGRLPVRLTLGALLVFDAAQRCEGRGLSWGAALEQAGKVVVRFVDLLPDSAWATGWQRVR